MSDLSVHKGSNIAIPAAVADPHSQTEQGASPVAIHAEGHPLASQQLHTQPEGASLGERQVTVENSSVKDKIASLEHRDFMVQARGDGRRNMLLQQVGADIKSLERASLKRADMHEFTGLDNAKEEFRQNSLVDLGNSTISRGYAQEQPSLVGDPQFKDLSADFHESPVFLGMGAALKQAVEGAAVNEVATLAKDLGNLLAHDLASAPQVVLLGFVTSQGDAFKDSLLQALVAQTGGNPGLLAGHYATVDDQVKGFLDAAYTHAVCHLPDHQLDAENCMLGGNKYVSLFDVEGHLGQGAFGTVTRFTRFGVDEIIVVKALRLHDEGNPQELRDRFDETAREVRAHVSALGSGHPNVVGFKGAIRTSDGGIMIALDYADGGDIHGFIDALASAEKKGSLSSHSANLARITLLQDMIQGMQHVQEQRGMTHLDLKPLNIFIGEGIAKVGDFGTASSELRRQMFVEPDPVVMLNPTYQAPEILEYGTVTATGKADVWSLGVTAYHLFHGELPFDAADTDALGAPRPRREVWGDAREEVVNFGSDLSHRMQTRGQDFQGAPTGLGVSALDRVLNQMLHPDPQQRPSFTDVLASSIFHEPGVGSTEVRDLIVKLTTGFDPDDPAEEESWHREVKSASDTLGV